MDTAVCLAQRLYDAFARFDAPALAALLSNDFVGTVSDGMPAGVGGTHYGPTDMLHNVWVKITGRYDVRVQPLEYLRVSETKVVVLGRYRGRARDGQTSVNAAFAHVITTRDDHITGLHQITDTRSWHLPPPA
jgi:uncharacterized protein